MVASRVVMRHSPRWPVVAWVGLFAVAGVGSAAVAERQDLGRLEGVVRLTGGPVPPPTAVENTTDPEVCGRIHTLDDLIVDPESLGVADAFAILEPVAQAVPLPAGPDPRDAPRLRLDNVGCRFEPHAAIVPVGTVLEMVNSDQVLHTVHLYGPIELNQALPFRGIRIDRTLDLAGLYAVRCDVHGWMQALVRVVEGPYHAVSDRRGRFSIEAIVPGEYVLEVWHERLGSRRRTVRIEPAVTRSLVVDLALPSEP